MFNPFKRRKETAAPNTCRQPRCNMREGHLGDCAWNQANEGIHAPNAEPVAEQSVSEFWREAIMSCPEAVQDIKELRADLRKQGRL